MQAVGLESCESFQEETVSDQEGQYRLRGLQVSCFFFYKKKTAIQVHFVWSHDKLRATFDTSFSGFTFPVLGTRTANQR